MADISSWAATAGIGGIALGLVTLIFRDIIAKNIFGNLPADHTYRLLRLIVVCAFILGLTGTVGYIWLQNSAQAATKNSLQSRLDAAISELNRVNNSQDLYALPSLNRYANTPSDGNWAVARTDLQRIWNSIENAKSAIIDYNANTKQPLDFTEINDLLSLRHSVIAQFVFSRPDDPLPHPESVQQFVSEYRELTKRLSDALTALKEKVKRS